LLNHIFLAGIRGLPDENFTKNPEAQFCGNNFFGDHLFAINDQSTALRALRTIIEQGEGNLRVDDSHYDVFSKLYSRPQVWDVHLVPDNPKTVDYWNKYQNNYAYRVGELPPATFLVILHSCTCFNPSFPSLSTQRIAICCKTSRGFGTHSRKRYTPCSFETSMAS